MCVLEKSYTSNKFFKLLTVKEVKSAENLDLAFVLFLMLRGSLLLSPIK